MQQFFYNDVCEANYSNVKYTIIIQKKNLTINAAYPKQIKKKIVDSIRILNQSNSYVRTYFNCIKFINYSVCNV